MRRFKDFKWTDKAAGKIAGVGIKLQTKFSDFMNRVLNRMTHKKMKAALFVFCIVWGGMSIYFIAAAFLKSGIKQPQYKVDRIKSPQHFNNSGDETITPVIDEKTYRQIQEYKKYMDSIRQPIRQSLLDSINLLEKMYDEENKYK